MSVVPDSGRLAVGAAALALSISLACAGPSLAQFSPREGFSDDGESKVAVEASPYLFLPYFNASIGLNRPSQEDPGVSRPRPTLASILPKLSFAFTCDCLVRYGNFSAETNIIYVDLKEQTNVPPVPPDLPQALIHTKTSLFFISPGIGYRVYSSVPNKMSLDARAGFSYGDITASADFTAGDFSAGGSRSPSYIVPWLGERFDYYPTNKWRIENTLSLTGLGANNGTIGYTGKLSASYLFNRWFDMQLGYAVVETHRNPDILPDGANRSLHVLMYGPVMGFGLRF